jgi:acetolactate synthase I/II/III large subunit
VILSLGARFEEMETNWRAGFVPPPTERVIQVDIDAAEVGRSMPAHLAVIGDIRAVLKEMIDVVGEAPPARGTGASLLDFSAPVILEDADGRYGCRQPHRQRP